ncbi:MAG: branched-chain amino acid ABC transporter substrate-binding protein [Candidatus Omnitrophota bacterium]
MKRLLCFALLVWTGVCLNGCGAKKETKKEAVVKIALVCPLTGDIAAMGQGMKNAAVLAIEEANQNKVIKDTRFELVALDDRADPKEAVSAATQIVSDKKIFGVVGHLNSGCSIPASAVYNRHNIVMISPASTNPKLTFQGFKNVLRTCTTDDVQGSFAAGFIYKSNNFTPLEKKERNSLTGFTKVAVIHDKTPYGQGLAEEFKKTFQGLGGIIVCFEGVSLGDRDFKALLIKIKNLNPQAIYFGGMYQEAGLISKQAKQLGLDVPLVGGDGIYSSEYIKIAGNASEGDLATMIGLPPEKLSKSKDFVEKYKSRFPNRDMQPYDPYTYDTVNIIIEAVKNTGRDKTKIIEYIKDMKYEGIIGVTQFDDKGDTLNKEITCYEVKNGRWTIAK